MGAKESKPPDPWASFREDGKYPPEVIQVNYLPGTERVTT